MKILLLILMLLFACQTKPKDGRETAYLLSALAIVNYQNSNCRAWSGNPNQLYFDTSYSGKFIADTKQYTTIVIGDSTMDFSTRLSGYLSSTSQTVAVAGNTLCDMSEQLPSINTLNPSYILIATTGGN